MNAEASIAYSPGLANDAMNGVDDEHHKDTGFPKKRVPQNCHQIGLNWFLPLLVGEYDAPITST